MRDNNFSSNDIGSHNHIHGPNLGGCGSQVLLVIAGFCLVGITACVIYTAIAYAAIVSIVVPILVGLGVLGLIALGINFVVQQTARTFATISHARAQKERNAVLTVAPHVVITQDRKTGKLEAHSIVQRTENYHYGDKGQGNAVAEADRNLGWSELEG